MGPKRPPKTLSMYAPREYNGNKWGMSIDLNACTGCSVCIIACVAGEQHRRSSARTRSCGRARCTGSASTRTSKAASTTPDTYHQPVPCQQCENAPCEPVCPVAATVHSDEGLNDMVYNRCVGTRYCSNNCPYKVRRFNFLLYSDFTTPELEAQRNPDVTIRSRGVMEKCTYCVQRISHARIDAKTDGPRHQGRRDRRRPASRRARADAIVFGNLNDPDEPGRKLKTQERNYGLLEDLGTRPRTTYLAVVRNPNPAGEEVDKA